MPAKKIIEAVGYTCAVMGSSMATVTAGPKPGNTPMAVPSAQPARAHSRLMGVPAVAKPPMSWVRMSDITRSICKYVAGAAAPSIDAAELALPGRRHRPLEGVARSAAGVFHTHPLGLMPGRFTASTFVNTQY